ncbi:hypothetical protein [Humisphaera borealis]|uniref:Uncharacterized protein n=1 Tax=Humisphaera borealis TaxID=2807512 RepID=A0A7M2WZY9_9BACT|nr:hypothetical protein [Humisphaera borealis]QOV91077.1 hypothetical protein IPV69_06875 [Humisphaera borealis]
MARPSGSDGFRRFADGEMLDTVGLAQFPPFVSQRMDIAAALAELADQMGDDVHPCSQLMRQIAADLWAESGAEYLDADAELASPTVGDRGSDDVIFNLHIPGKGHWNCRYMDNGCGMVHIDRKGASAFVNDEVTVKELLEWLTAEAK